jgi:putative transposase
MIDELKTTESLNGTVRRSSRVLGFRRQTYYGRKQGHRPEQVDQQIADLLHQTVKRFVAWGFWMVFHFLRKQGHHWNHKRVYRVWRAEQLNLRLPVQRPKIRRVYQDLISPAQINEGWAVDFLSDWVVGPNQQAVRIINVIDEASRKALWTEAHNSISAKTLCEALDQIVEWRGCPAYIRCDNGPEFISIRLQQWADLNHVDIKFTQPGKPTQNGIIERLNGTLRKECLNLYWFETLDKLNEQIQQWWLEYNSLRPHSSIQYQTPDEMEERNKKFYFKPVAA